MTLSGQVRSGRSTTICSWKGRYLCTGMGLGFWWFFIMNSCGLVRLALPQFRGSYRAGYRSPAAVVKAVHQKGCEGEMPRQKAGTVAADSSVPRSGE